MYEAILAPLSRRPALYASGDGAFWDDDHISQYMLAAHLSPDMDAASRKPAFLDRSAAWIAGLAARGAGTAGDAGKPRGAESAAAAPTLLDLGCGPGLYAERFCRAGFAVTGVDLSRRSIAYARESAARAGLPIAYRCADYLSLSDENAFDMATLIYCDFGVMSPDARLSLLRRTRAALRAGGLLVLDGWTPAYLETFKEGCSASVQEGGFWSAEPHLLIETDWFYPETNNCLEQYVVVTRDACRCHRVWNQIFTPESLTAELRAGGFGDIRLFGDVAGAPLSADGRTLCAVARAL